MQQPGPNPNAAFPNPNNPGVCFIKNVITRPNILVGDYTYYSDDDHPENFEAHVTHHYEFLGDRLIIGKFCAIGKGINFMMNGANHRMASATTYPFNIMANGWEAFAPTAEDLPFKGDTVVGSDVWFGENITVMPGIYIGSGSIIAAGTVVANDVPPYCVVGGNPAHVIRQRFGDAMVQDLLDTEWWNWAPQKIYDNMALLCSRDTDSSIRKLIQAGRQP